MSSEQVVSITASVVLLTQIVKWAVGGVAARTGEAVIVALLSLLGVGAWAVSTGKPFTVEDVWPYFAAYVAVLASSAGVFGFARANGSKDVARGAPLLPGRRARWSADHVEEDE